jgi:hypothetical protein
LFIAKSFAKYRQKTQAFCDNVRLRKTERPMMMKTMMMMVERIKTMRRRMKTDVEKRCVTSGGWRPPRSRPGSSANVASSSSPSFTYSRELTR